MEAVNSYGPAQKGVYYKIVGEGYDWYSISVKGKIVYVPRWVF